MVGVSLLDFDAEAEARSTSWERADPDRALIERRSWNEWSVLLPDGEKAHICRLERDHGAYVGACDCPGYEHHDGPCAHLCTLRKAEFGHDRDVEGRRVRVLDADEERAQGAVERIRADGGRRRWGRTTGATRVRRTPELFRYVLDMYSMVGHMHRTLVLTE